MHPEESPPEFHRPTPPPPSPATGDGESNAEDSQELVQRERPVSSPDLRSGVSLSQRQIMGITGGLFLILGVFLPIISIPVVGTVNVLTANLLVAGLLILVGGYSAVRALKNDFRFLTWNAYGALVIIALLGVMVFASAVTEAGNAEVTGMEEAMLQATTLEWGWVVLLLGAFLLIAAGHVNDDFRVRRAN